MVHVSSLRRIFLCAAVIIIPVLFAVSVTHASDRNRHLSIPEQFGTLEQISSYPSGKTILHIQDAHCYYPVQQQIANIIEYFADTGQITHVFIEGADSQLDTTEINSFPDNAIRNMVADYFLKEGKITGVEYSLITANQPLEAYGVEERELYRENYRIFAEAQSVSADITATVANIRAILNDLKQDAFSSPLFEHDQRRTAYFSGEDTLRHYLTHISRAAAEHQIDITTFEAFADLLAVMAMEKKLDHYRIEQQKNELIVLLQSKLSDEQKITLLDATLNYSLKKFDSQHLFHLLGTYCEMTDVSIDQFDALKTYLAYLNASNKIDINRVDTDIRRISGLIEQQLCTTDIQRNIITADQFLDQLGRLVSLTSSSSDIEKYAQMRSDFTAAISRLTRSRYAGNGSLAVLSERLLERTARFESFYNVALRRDRQLVANTVAAMDKNNIDTAILITGGFHARGICELLSRTGISVSTIKPGMLSDHPDTPSSYTSVILGHRNALEQYLFLKWQTLAVAASLVSGTPLVQEWKGPVYRREMDLIPLVMKLAALCTKLQTELGVATSDALTDTFAKTIAAQLQTQSKEFLSLWNERHTQLTGSSHPFADVIDVRISTAQNELFVTVSLNDEDITFPLTHRFAVDPAAIVNAYLTPERFTAIIAGNASLRESITTVEQLKQMRKKIKEILFRSQSISDQITEEDNLLIASIIKSLLNSQSSLTVNAARQLPDDASLGPQLATTINEALFERQLEQFSTTLGSRLSYDGLRAIIKYGAAAPIHVIMKELKEAEPALSRFAAYIIDNFSLFTPDQTEEEIRSVLRSLHDRYLAVDTTGLNQSLDSLLLDRIARIIDAALNFGDGIRPHGVAIVLAYGLHPFVSTPLDEIVEIHDLLEQESIYSTNEVIMMLFYSHWINADTAAVLIKSPLPFKRMITLMNSEEWKAMRVNPSSYTFNKFVRRYIHFFTQPTIIQLFSSILEPTSPLRIALESLTEEGWDSEHAQVQGFATVTAQIKSAHQLSGTDALTYDMIIYTIFGSIPQELSTSQPESQGAVASFDRIDKMSDLYDPSLASTFFTQANNAGQMNVFAFEPGFPSNSESVTAESGLELTRERYQSIITTFITTSEIPSLVFVDAQHSEDIREQLEDAHPAAHIIIVPFDYKKRDLALTGKKRLDFLGYRINLIDGLRDGNFRGVLNIAGLDKNTFSWFDDYSRNTISLDTALARAGKPTEMEYAILAKQPDRQLLSALIESGSLTPTVTEILIANDSFAVEQAIHLLQNTSLSPHRPALAQLAQRFQRYDLVKIFNSVQNMRSAHLFTILASDFPDKMPLILSDVDPAKLAALVALSQKLGFQFTGDIFPDNLTRDRWSLLAQHLAVISPHLASNFISVVFSNDTKAGIRLISDLSKDREVTDVMPDILHDIIGIYAVDHPDFHELGPFVDSDILPIQHKTFVVSRTIELLSSNIPIQSYIYAIISVFSEDGPFMEWVDTNISKHEDRVHEWIHIVSLFPDSDELRSTPLLTSAIKTDKHILTSYAQFVEKVASHNEPYAHLHDDADSFELIFKAVNATFAQPVETKMFVFHILPYINEFLPEGVSMKSLVEQFAEKTDHRGKVIEQGIPLYALLPALVIADKDMDVLDAIRRVFSSSYIAASISTKQRIASNMLRIFAKLDQAQIYAIIKPGNPLDESFIKSLRLDIDRQQREDIYTSLEASSQSYRQLLSRFDIARRKQLIVRKISLLTPEAFAKKDQKLFADVIEFMFILSDNYHVLQQDDEDTHRAFDQLIDSIDTYNNVRDLRAAVMQLFARFIKLDFPDVFQSEEDLMEKLPRIEEVTNYWLYRTDLQQDTPRGMELMRKAIEGYLKDGLSLKHIKYGGTPETKVQLELYEAILTRTIKERLLEDNPRLSPDDVAKRAHDEAQQYLDAWQRDAVDRINLDEIPELKETETIVAWTSDDVPDWLRFGLSGGGTCLAPGNVSSYTKNLPGYIFSGLVSGGLYLGTYKGDIRDRVNQALVPVTIRNKTHMYVVNQYYYSSGGPIAHDIGVASVIAAIRNAAQFGANGVIIPTGSPQAAYLNSMSAFLERDFSTVVERRNASGKLIAREKITIRSIARDNVDLIVPREPNQFRYFDAASSYKGKYVDKLDPNFSFVDFDYSAPHEIDGIVFDGLDITTSSIIVFIDREILPLETPSEIEEQAPALSDALQDFISQGRLTVLSETNPELRERFNTLAVSERTTGKYLNQLLFLSDQLSRQIDTRFIDRQSDNQHLVLSVSQRAIPIARKLTNMLDGVDYITGDINANQNTITGLNRLDVVRRGTVFLVDEGILTGSTAVKNIETILSNELALPEEIVFVALTADPSTAERLMRKYPDLRIVIGTFESRAEHNGEFVSPLLSNLADKTQKLDLSTQTRVKVGGTEYKVLHRIQRGDSFVAYLAESPTGEQVFLKTTVSKDEGERFVHIWELVENQSSQLGVPKVHQYDEETGVLVLSNISGPTLLEYIQHSQANPEHLLLNLMDALKDILDVSRFLSSQGALFVNITPSNVRIDPQTGKWYITNYSPFPYRVQPLSEEGVLQQMGWMADKITEQFKYTIDPENTEHTRIFDIITDLTEQLQSGSITSIDQLSQKRAQITRSLLSAADFARLFKLQGSDSTEFFGLTGDPVTGPAILEQLHNILRESSVTTETVRGALLSVLRSSAMETLDKRTYFTDTFGTLIDEISARTLENVTPEFIDVPDQDDLFDVICSPDPLKPTQLSAFVRQTASYKSKLTAYITRARLAVEEGRAVFFTGNMESIKWMYSQIYQELGKKAESSLYILNTISYFPLKQYVPQKLLAKPVVSADQLFFRRPVTRGTTTFTFSEASLIDCTDLASLYTKELAYADDMRLRIIHNPRLTMSVRNDQGKQIAVICATAQTLPSLDTMRTFPVSSDRANALVYYSLISPEGYENKAWFRDMLLEAEYHVGLKFQYAESFQSVNLDSLLGYTITHKYLPRITNLPAHQDIIEDVTIRGNTDRLIDFFPDSPAALRPYIHAAIVSLWSGKSDTLAAILTSRGAQQFTATVIKTVIENIVLNYPHLFDDTTVYALITDLLGTTVAPLEYIASSRSDGISGRQQRDSIYESYRQKLASELPNRSPMSRESFETILNSPQGPDAFGQWLTYHYPDFADSWRDHSPDSRITVDTSFAETFGSALLLFVQSTGRNLIDTHFHTALMNNEGITYHIAESTWIDPFNGRDIVGGMGISLFMRIPYLIGSEEDYFYSWFDESIARQLRTLLENVPEQMREQLLVKLVNLNMDRYNEVELMFKTILASPISDERKLELLNLSIEATGKALGDAFGYQKSFYIIDAEAPLPAKLIQNRLPDTNTILILIGASDTVTQAYNSLTRQINRTNIHEVSDVNKRVVGLTALIRSEKITVKTAGHITHFALQDESLAAEKLLSWPLIEFTDPVIQQTATSELISRYVVTMFGSGGVLSKLAEEFNQSLTDLTGISVMPFAITDSNAFLQVTLSFGNNQFDHIVRVSVHNADQMNNLQTRLQKNNVDILSDRDLQPVNTIARRTAAISTDHSIELAVYKTLPFGSRLLTRPLFSPAQADTEPTYSDRIFVRQVTQRLTHLYLRYGVTPDPAAYSFLIDELQDTIDLYLLTDSALMEPVTGDEQFIFGLIQRTHPSLMQDIIKGMLDGFDGNVTAFDRFAQSIITSDFRRFAVTDTTAFAQAHIDENIPHDQRTKIIRAIAKEVFEQYDSADTFSFDNLIDQFTGNGLNRESLASIARYAQSVRTSIRTAQQTTEYFLNTSIGAYQPAAVDFQLTKLRSLQQTEVKAGRSIAAREVSACMDLLFTSRLRPLSFIRAKLSFSRQRFIEFVSMPDGTIVPNPDAHRELVAALDTIADVLRTDPNNIMTHIKSIAANTNIAESMLLGLILPKYDSQTKTTQFGPVRIRISQLPLLLRVEKILARQPIALTGNSTSLNFQLFSTIQDLFNLQSFSTGQLISRSITSARGGSPDTIATQKALVANALADQSIAFAVDMAEKSNKLVYESHAPSMIFDLRDIDDLDTFLQRFTLVYDSNDIERISFDPTAIIDRYFSTIPATQRPAVREIIQTVMKLRMLLKNAAADKESDRTELISYARSLGIQDSVRDLLVSEQLRAPSYTISAHILDALARSGSLPRLSDLIDTVKTGGTIDEAKFIILLDVYSSLAIDYFARKIAGLSANQEVTLDVDMGLIKTGADTLIELGDDHSFVLDMLASAQIRHKTFAQGTPVDKIVRFARSVKSTYPLFIRDAATQLTARPQLGQSLESDTPSDPLQYRLPGRNRIVLESSL